MKEPGESKLSRFRCLNGRHHMTDRTCSFDACERPLRARGLCNGHWIQMRKGWELRPLRIEFDTLREKIEHYLERDENGCLIWQRALNPNGYGHVRWHRKSFAVHRQYWIELGREIPEGLELDHLCRVPACANPDHLEPVTHTENVRRGIAGWQYRAKTHCIYGHEFTLENTLITKDGYRNCLECRRRRSREYRARKKANA